MIKVVFDLTQSTEEEQEKLGDILKCNGRMLDLAKDFHLVKKVNDGSDIPLHRETLISYEKEGDFGNSVFVEKEIELKDIQTEISDDIKVKKIIFLQVDSIEFYGVAYIVLENNIAYRTKSEEVNFKSYSKIRFALKDFREWINKRGITDISIKYCSSEDYSSILRDDKFDLNLKSTEDKIKVEQRFTAWKNGVERW